MIRHLYVHIPFCHRICPYCSFYKHEPGGTDMAAFLRALTAELKADRSGPRELETVYFGGGTPTLLSSGHLERWLPEFVACAGMVPGAEWTVEVNPRTITEKKAALLRSAGVTRVSLGIQSWDPEVLRTLGRDHSPEEAMEAWRILVSAGFPVCNVDLMFSVPGQSLESWGDTVERTLALGPRHISAYNLTYEEDTEFFERFRSGEYLREESVDEAYFAEVIRQTRLAGMEHYEISNYAQPGHESRHNAAYWAGADSLGIGPGAVSTVSRKRWKNLENTVLYMQRALAGESVRQAGSEEEIDDAAWACERIALELRTSRGVDLALLPDAGRVAETNEGGLTEVRDGRLVLTPGGRFVADSVAGHLWA
jgi:oxygen-independent coproporphyrinogen-3 oxidase